MLKKQYFNPWEMNQMGLAEEETGGSFWDNAYNWGSDQLEKVIDAGGDIAVDKAKEIIRGDRPGGELGPPPPGSQKVDYTEDSRITGKQPESGLVSTLKSIPPWVFGAGVGLATKWLSKSWLGAAIAGGAAYFLTDKMSK